MRTLMARWFAVLAVAAPACAKAVLVSNSRLEAALRLYEQRGFRYAPLPATMPYATADVYMELELTPDEPAA